MRSSFLALLALGLSPAAHAADLVFAPQYKAGEVYRSEVETEVEQSLTLNGMQNVATSSQFMIMSESVETANASGATLRGGFDSIQISVDAGGMMYSFNSANPGATTPPAMLQPLHDLLTELCDAEWTTSRDDDGRIESMEYLDNALADVDPALQSEVDLQRYIDEANQQAERLPGGGIEVGQTWDRTEVVPLGNGQQFRLEKQFTYRGPETVNGRALERVDVESVAVEYTVTPNPALPVSVKSSTLQVETTDGAFWYDAAIGDIVKSTETIHVTGDLELEAAGMVLAGELDLTLSISMSTSRQ